MRAKNAYDMQQVIRYYDAWCRVPEVSLYLQNIQINKMMRYYTDDKRVLELAAIAEKLYDSDDVSGEKYVKDHITTMRGLLRKLKRTEKSIK